MKQENWVRPGRTLAQVSLALSLALLALAPATAATFVVDNGDSGFSATGFRPFGGTGFGNDYVDAPPGNGEANATWTFHNLTPGLYRVSVTWPAVATNASDAPFSLNGGPEILFDQSVAPDDFTANGANWDDLSLAFAVTGSPMTVTLNNAADQFVVADAVRFDAVPLAGAVTRAGANPTGAATVAYAVTFSEPVSGVDADDFSLTTGGLTGVSVASVAGSGSAWTVSVNAGSGEGQLRLDLVDDDTIRDSVGSPLGGPGTGNGNLIGETYTFDRTPPQVTALTRTGASPTHAASVAYALTFGEAIIGLTTDDFALITTGSLSGSSVASVSGSGVSWSVTVNTGSGAGNLRLDFVDRDTVTDVAGNPVAGPGAGGAFVGETYGVDRAAPTVTINQAAGQADPAATGPILFEVVFSEPVTGLALEDIAVSGPAGTTAQSVTGSGATYTLALDGMAHSGVVTANVKAGAAADGLGNSSLASTSADNQVTFLSPLAGFRVFLPVVVR